MSTELTELYFENGNFTTAAIRAYKSRHKLRDYPYSDSTAIRTIKRFRASGSVGNQPRDGRPSAAKKTAKKLLKKSLIDKSQDNIIFMM